MTHRRSLFTLNKQTLSHVFTYHSVLNIRSKTSFFYGMLPFSNPHLTNNFLQGAIFHILVVFKQIFYTRHVFTDVGMCTSNLAKSPIRVVNVGLFHQYEYFITSYSEHKKQCRTQVVEILHVPHVTEYYQLLPFYFLSFKCTFM